MTLVIGKENCSSCEITKNILKNKNIEFEYKLLDSLKEEDKDKYLKLAKEGRQMSMPLIIKNQQLVTLQEVIG